jgi:hypothetical protein
MLSMKHKIYLLILSLCSVTANAQLSEMGVWTGFGIEKDFGKLDLSAQTELRTIYGIRLVDRWSLGLDGGYKLSKYLKLGVGYNFMNVLDEKYLNYQFRHRFNVSASGKFKTDRFTFSLRERLQLTTKDDSNRIRTDGSIDSYGINPALVWRNRLLIDYDIPQSKLTPSVSVESFYELNNPNGNTFNKFRYTATLDYKLNKTNTVSIYGLYNNRTDDDDNYSKYVLGISYKIAIK